MEKPKGSGIWYARWWDHNKKERTERGRNKTDAARIYRERKAVVKRAKNDPDFRARLEAMNKKELTLGEFLRSQEPTLKRHRSWRDMKRFLDRWHKIIGDLPLSKISKSHAKKREAGLLAKGRKPATINREISFLQARLQDAVDQDLIAVNPLAGYKKLREDNIIDRFLTEAEEERLAPRMTPEDFELVEMAIHTGIRQERLFTLAWTHISFEDGGWITVENAKGGK